MTSALFYGRKTMKIKALKSFASDSTAEDEGKWAPITEGIEFKIRRLRSKPVQEAQRRIYGPFERASRGKELPDAIETQCTIHLISQAIVVDWRGPGMVEEILKGKETVEVPVEFSVEKCAQLISDPEIGRDLRASVLSFATDSDFYAPVEQELDLGNSAAT